MLLLSFDTSTSCLSVAIADHGKVLAQSDVDSGPTAKADRQESVSALVPTIDRLVKGLGLNKKDLGALAIGVGPGGFTGVRVAVVTGRTLAQALNLPVVGVNNLEMLSYGDASAAGAGVLKFASKTQCFAAAYRRVQFGDGEFYDLQASRGPSCAVFPLMAEEIEAGGGQWLAEEAVINHFADYPAYGQIGPLPPVYNIAAIQAKIAHVRLSLKAEAGEDLLTAFNYRLIQPLYLRGASVTLKKGDVIERVETY